MLILELPFETLEEIVGQVDKPADLYNLALASKILASIIIPRHLHYRIIRCRLDTHSVWKQLSEDLSLARNVRKLEVQRDQRGFAYRQADRLRVPRGLEMAQAHLPVLRRDFSDKGLEKQRSLEFELILALKNMSNLTHFKWNRAPPFIDARSGGETEDLWAVLKACRGLMGLDVVDASELSTIQHWAPETDGKFLKPIWNSNIFALSNLTSFKITSYASNGASTAIDMSRLNDMLLNRCPNLEELHISLVLYANLASKLGDGEPLLSQAKWPRLRSVRLSTVQCSPQTTATFFSAHPSIKKLVIFGDAVLPTAGSNLPSGILPQLEIVQCKLESVIDILESLPSPHPISHISLSDGTFDYPLKDRFCGLMKRFDNLKRLEFVRTLLPKDIDLIAEAVSQLEWLRIAFRPVTQKRENAYILAFARFPQIKTVEGIQFLPSEPLKRNDPKLLKLLRRLPTLRRIDAWGPDPLDRYYRPVLILKWESPGSGLTWELRDTTGASGELK